MQTIKNRDYFWENENKEKQKKYLNTKFELIREISNEQMNKECFDCNKKNPKYISINNAIFLCEECAQLHKTFPDNISVIIDNNLNLLSNNYLKYLFYGGNANLDNFINYEYPGLQNYSPEILYKTQAMIYYREVLKNKIEGKPKPISPIDIMAYKLVTENGLINIREGKKFKTRKKSQNKLSNKDIINNYYNNYNNTYNTYNNYNYNNQDIINNNNMNQNNKVRNNNNSNNCNNTKSLKYCSLVNKAFFNEMKNLFGKKLSQSSYNPNTKSYNNISKTQNKFKNYTLLNNNVNTEQSVNQSLTYRMDESINYSMANTITANEPLTTTRHLNNSAFSDETIKSPIQYNTISRYIKPLIRKSVTIKKPVNKYSTEKETLKKKKLTIDLAQLNKYTESYNSLKKNNLYKQKKKVLDFFRIKKKAKNCDEKNNLTFDKNTLQKNQLLEKINNSMKSYLYIKHNNNINNKVTKTDINNQKEKENKTVIEYNNNFLININDKQKLNINNDKNKNVVIKEYKKKNTFNISDNRGEERIPIKVNLNLSFGKNNNSSDKKSNYERKKKALKDKMEQELLEQEALHNLQFEKKDSDIFNNIICLNDNE